MTGLYLPQGIQKTKQPFVFLTWCCLFLCIACSKDNKENRTHSATLLDTLVVAHSMKGWEIYSWPYNNGWRYSVMIGTNRIKTYAEVTSDSISGLHLISVSGADTLELVLDKFPADEYITWLGPGWLQSSWGSNCGNLQLPPQSIIDEIRRVCLKKNLNLQVTD
ncbi:MAG: hypothetical protein WCR72_17695 [Bacteroidota bacterium]